MAIGPLTLPQLIKLNKLYFLLLKNHQSNDMGNDLIILEMYLRAPRGWRETRLPLGSIYEMITMCDDMTYSDE